LKYFNADIFNIPFKYYFNYVDSNNFVITDGVEYRDDGYNMIYIMYVFTCTLIAIFVGYVFYYYEPEFDSDGNEIIGDSDTENNMQKEINGKPLVGLYTESIMEVVKMNDVILDKMLESETDKTMYWVLLRVQMKHPLDMNKTKFELHGNHTSDIKANKFTTKDAFMLMKFIYNKGINNKINGNNDNNSNSNGNVNKTY